MVARADFVIRNARLIDGTGAPSVVGALAVRDDRIVAIGEVGELAGAIEIDAAGRALAPGFIDVHTHDDRALRVQPLMASKASQGVTTVVTGNCGISLAPLTLAGRPPAPLDLLSEDGRDFYSDFGAYLTALEQEPPALNAMCQVGHSSLRIGAMDRLDRPATAGEIRVMQRQLERALEAGAIGLSTGLAYAPAAAAPTGEITELARTLHTYGALYTTHLRNENAAIDAALEEAFTIGRTAGVPVVLSHHKCSGKANHGHSSVTLALIEQARQVQPLGLDAYPYTASSTILDLDYVLAIGKVIVTWSQPHPEVAGRELAAIAADWGLDTAETVARLQPAGAIYFAMDEADVRRILAYPYTMIGSDGLPHDTHPHPRLWGTFPRVLGHYVRDVGLFPLEEAVRRMTELPAAQFGLTRRGVLRINAYADLVLFDPDTVADRATFAKPQQPAAGIEQVWVNGRVVWKDGAVTGERPGRVLRRQELALPEPQSE